MKYKLWKCNFNQRWI